MNQRLQGIGMTSRRTRDRMIKRLKEQGITDQNVLSVMSDTPRHIFVDEALASRSYDKTKNCLQSKVLQKLQEN